MNKLMNIHFVYSEFFCMNNVLCVYRRYKDRNGFFYKHCLSTDSRINILVSQQAVAARLSSIAIAEWYFLHYGTYNYTFFIAYRGKIKFYNLFCDHSENGKDVFVLISFFIYFIIIGISYKYIFRFNISVFQCRWSRWITRRYERTKNVKWNGKHIPAWY